MAARSTEAGARRLAMSVYGSAYLKRHFGGTATVRIVKVKAA